MKLRNNLCKIFILAALVFLPGIFFATPTYAVSIGWNHSQGATITKKYFLFATLDEIRQGGAPASIYRCNRSGAQVSGCKKIISGRFGHANVLEHNWGLEYFWIIDKSNHWCYSLSGKKVSNSKCGSLPVSKWPSSGGLTSQGKTQYGDYFVKAYGNTRNVRSRIVVMKKNSSGVWKTIKKLEFSSKHYREEIEDVMVDGDTGNIYYTMSGCFSSSCWATHNQEVRLYKYSGYKLPIASQNTAKKKSSSTSGTTSSKTSSTTSGATKSSNNASYNTIDANCVQTSIIGNDGQYCDDGQGSGVYVILNIVLTVLTFGIGIAATAGLVICGIKYATSGTNEAQATNARRRIFEIVIGLIAYALMYLALQWLIPGFS